MCVVAVRWAGAPLSGALSYTNLPAFSCHALIRSWATIAYVIHTIPALTPFCELLDAAVTCPASLFSSHSPSPLFFSPSTHHLLTGLCTFLPLSTCHRFRNGYQKKLVTYYILRFLPVVTFLPLRPLHASTTLVF